MSVTVPVLPAPPVTVAGFTRDRIHRRLPGFTVRVAVFDRHCRSP